MTFEQICNTWQSISGVSESNIMIMADFKVIFQYNILIVIIFISILRVLIRNFMLIAIVSSSSHNI